MLSKDSLEIQQCVDYRTEKYKYVDCKYETNFVVVLLIFFN